MNDAIWWLIWIMLIKYGIWLVMAIIVFIIAMRNHK